nr:MAG TPA: hypothetical protein [Caudoviricetes sp.]
MRFLFFLYRLFLFHSFFKKSFHFSFFYDIIILKGGACGYTPT